MTKIVKCAACGMEAECPQCGCLGVWIDDHKLETADPPQFKLKHATIKHDFTDALRRFIYKYQKDNQLPPSFALSAEIGLNQVIMMTDCLDQSLNSIDAD